MSDEDTARLAGHGAGSVTKRSMPLSKPSLQEVGALELEVQLALTNPSLPFEKRAELERRLAEIRAKMGGAS
jgi:hypothetical protein